MRKQKQTLQDRLHDLEDELRRAIIAGEDTEILRLDIEQLRLQIAAPEQDET